MPFELSSNLASLLVLLTIAVPVGTSLLLGILLAFFKPGERWERHGQHDGFASVGDRHGRALACRWHENVGTDVAVEDLQHLEYFFVRQNQRAAEHRCSDDGTGHIAFFRHISSS